MNNIISTLVIEALDSAMANQAGATATSIADAAATNRLAVQLDGQFTQGTVTNTSATRLIKLSAATTMSDGTISVMSTSEFKLGDIIASHYSVPSAGTTATYTLDYTNAVKVGGMFFLRLERRDGLGINDSETYSGETLAKLVTAFTDRSEFTEFGNVTLTAASATSLTVAVAAKDANSDVHISANDGVSFTDVNPVNKKGSLSVAKSLERSGFISQGAYNQYGFPIVVPETSTASGQDYGIFTIELRKKVGGRFVHETIKVLIADDEANENKTATAINNILKLTAADVTKPDAVTATAFVTDDGGGTPAGNTYTDDAAVAIFVKATGCEIGTTITITLDSNGSEADHVQSFSVTATNDVYAITGVDSTNYAENAVVTAKAVLTDASGNVSDAASSAGTVTIA